MDSEAAHAGRLRASPLPRLRLGRWKRVRPRVKCGDPLLPVIVTRVTSSRGRAPISPEWGLCDAIGFRAVMEWC